MASFRPSRRYLRCFYCNIPSKTRYDASIRDFLCPHCDATNYLDEHGEITDPPVATTTTPTSTTQYAIPQSASASATARSPESESSAHPIFCAECLKNQHLFTASLAQYYPDDINHPEYAQLEQRYYQFRANLEKRYPQICADCEPKVLSQLNSAGYVARSDYLRRAMERSRSSVVTPRQRSLLGSADTLGRWLWWGALAPQLLWHLAAIVNFSMADIPIGEEGYGLSGALITCASLLERLPPSEKLIRASLLMTVFAMWWNPKLPQVWRGFSRPVVGLRKWYGFQLVLVVVRFLFPLIVSLEARDDQQANAQLAIHVFMACLVCYIYVVAKRCVTIDARPLFAPAEILPSHTRTQTRRPNRESHRANHQKLSDVLDDVLNTPRPTATAADFGESPQSSPTSPLARRLHTQPSEPPKVSPRQDPDEMEWSPTQSPYPAFRDARNEKLQPFGHPQEEDRPLGRFWAKLPVAPKPPAHRVYNLTPPVEQAIKTDRDIFKARFGGEKLNGSANRTTRDRVAFAQPSFFAPTENKADPRSSLADMLNTSFSLSQEEDARNANLPSNEPSPQHAPANPFAPPRPFPVPQSGNAPVNPGLRALRAGFLAAMLGLWLYAVRYPSEHSIQIMRASLAMSAMFTLRMAKSALDSMMSGRGASAWRILDLVWCLVEIGAVSYLSFEIWTSESLCESCFEQGLWTMVAMLGHQLWDVIG